MMAETLGPLPAPSQSLQQSSGFFKDTAGAVVTGGAWGEGVREGGGGEGEEGREEMEGGGKGGMEGVSDRERSEWIECVRNEGYNPSRRVL